MDGLLKEDYYFIQNLQISIHLEINDGDKRFSAISGVK